MCIDRAGQIFCSMLESIHLHGKLRRCYVTWACLVSVERLSSPVRIVGYHCTVSRHVLTAFAVYMALLGRFAKVLN